MSTALAIDQQPRTSGVSCIGFTPISGRGALVGFADLHVMAFHMRFMGCPVFADEGRRWVGMPTRPIPARDGGKPGFSPTVAFDDAATQRRFSEAAIAAIDAYRGRG